MSFDMWIHLLELLTVGGIALTVYVVQKGQNHD